MCKTLAFLEVSYPLLCIVKPLSFYFCNFNNNYRLDGEKKSSEILRILPLLGPFAQDFAGIQRKLNKAFVKLEDVDVIKETLNNQNRNKNNNNYIEDINLQNNCVSNTCYPDDTSSYSYLSKFAIM